MKGTIVCIFLVCSYFISSGQTTLTGKIVEKATGQPIPGATVYISDLKTGSVSDVNGFYRVPNLPRTKVRLQVACMGYMMINQVVDLSITSAIDFSMDISVSELSEIVVTGHSQSAEKNRTATPVTTIPSIQLQQSSAVNIIDAISSQPGISEVTTGAAISKPVIRGLGYNRVVVVNDGIRQEGQQWGDEHGIEVDEFAVDHVEILKGPASLMYGSDAIAGVINFLSAPNLPDSAVAGKLLTNYQSNNGQIGYSFNLAGNNHDIIWNLRWSQKFAHAYRNKYDGYVFNSGFKERTFSGITGVNKSWGYSHLHYSMYFMSPGIVEGNRDSVTGDFIRPVVMNDSLAVDKPVSRDELQSYTTEVPFQEINHYKIVSNNNIILGNGSLKVIAGWQQNRRKEFGDVLHADRYGLYLVLNTINYDFRYVFEERKNYNIAIGINGMYQQSVNKGVEFLIPDYQLFDAGIYSVIRKSLDKLDISGGLRYDRRWVSSEDLFLDDQNTVVNHPGPGIQKKFSEFDLQFSGVSGSLGATYQLSEKWYTKVNAAAGYRSPNISELASNGEHEGSGRYEIGNTNLKAENSLQFDFAFGVNATHVTGELNLFTNTISNFIYNMRIENSQGGDSLVDGLPVYFFTSEKANLSGGELSIDIHPHPLDWLHFENTFSLVNGTRLNAEGSNHYLPGIPAPKFTSELKATSKKPVRFLTNTYVQAGVDYYFTQDKVYSENNTETVTPAYGLLNVGAGGEVTIKNKTWFNIIFSINNLLDKAYQNHLSRLKYAPENFASGRKGVFDMGRNMSVKIIVPFTIRTPKLSYE